MPRMTASKSLELESFWRAHLEGWRRSDLNQREYCELQGLPLKRFGNWRAKLRHEEPALAGKLLYRRGGGLSHMTVHTKNPKPGTNVTFLGFLYADLREHQSRIWGVGGSGVRMMYWN